MYVFAIPIVLLSALALWRVAPVFAGNHAASGIHAEEEKYGTRTLVALCVLNVIVGLPVNILPMTLAAIALDYGMDEAQLGQITGVYSGLNTLMIISAPFWILRFNWRKAMALGLIASLLAYVVGAYTGNATIIMVAFALLGISNGICFPILLTALGDMPNPDRAFGISVTLQVFFAAAATYLFPISYLAQWGFAGIMTGSAVVLLISFLFVSNIPFSKKEVTLLPENTASLSGSAATAPIICLIGLGLLFAGLMGLWVFVGQLGNTIGFTEAQIGAALAAALLASVGGAGLAAILGDRWGRTLPMSVSLGFLLAGIALYHEVDTYSTFVLAGCIFNVGWNMALVFALGAVAVTDTTGRMTPFSPSAMGLGAAIGVVLAGEVISGLGYATSFAISGLFLGVAAITIIIGSKSAAGR